MTTIEQGEGGRDQLSSLLRQLRRTAGLSGVQAGKLAGISQSKISRFESGLYTPTIDEAETLARIYKVSAQVRQSLIDMTADLQPGSTSVRLVLSRGAASFQQRVGRIERASQQVRTFTPAVVPGLLQTVAYARAIFASGEFLGQPTDDVEAAVRARLERQRLLHEDGRLFTLVMTEGALCWQAHSPTVMVEQLEHLAEVAKQSERVRVGVIPWTRPVHVFPMHGFDLYDSRAALVGTETATGLLTEPADVEAYVRLFAELEKLAVFGDVAASVFAGQTEEYRGLM